jgi:hypothetical protein
MTTLAKGAPCEPWPLDYGDILVPVFAESADAALRSLDCYAGVDFGVQPASGLPLDRVTLDVCGERAPGEVWAARVLSRKEIAMRAIAHPGIDGEAALGQEWMREAFAFWKEHWAGGVLPFRRQHYAAHGCEPDTELSCCQHFCAYHTIGGRCLARWPIQRPLDGSSSPLHRLIGWRHCPCGGQKERR